jgi:hypothetical protein
MVPAAATRAVIWPAVPSKGLAFFRSSRLPFDGCNSLYAAGALPFDAREVVVRLADEDSSSCSKREYRSAIKFAVCAELHHLREFITTAATERRPMVDTCITEPSG